MPQINHQFTAGKMNKDLDERLVPNGEYRDAMNIQVSTSDESEVGTVQNILGNSLISGQDFISDDAVCVGTISDEKENKLYYYVTNKDIISNGDFSQDSNNNGFADNWNLGTGWSWDAVNQIMVGDSVASQNAITTDVFEGKVALNDICVITLTVSNYQDGDLAIYFYNENGNGFTVSQFTPTNKTYRFIGTVGSSVSTNNNFIGKLRIRREGNTGFTGNIDNISVTYGNDLIIQHDTDKNIITPVLVDTTKEVLKFYPDKIITGINIIDDMLFWTDNLSEPKKINIKRSIEGTDINGITHTTFENKDTGGSVSIQEKHITVIKQKPVLAPSVKLIQDRDPDRTYTALTTLTNDNNFLNNVQIGSFFTMDLPTNANNESGFVLDWAVGDILYLKSFEGIDFDQKPVIPLDDFDLKLKIVSDPSNQFTDEDFEKISNFDFKIPSATGAEALGWDFSYGTYNYNNEEDKYELQDSAQYKTHTSPTISNLVEGGLYKLSLKISNYTEGSIQAWLIVPGSFYSPAANADTSKVYGYRLNSDATGSSVNMTSNGVYEFNFDLNLPQATNDWSSSQSSYYDNPNKVVIRTYDDANGNNTTLDIDYVSLQRLDASDAKVKVETLAINTSVPTIPVDKTELSFVVDKFNDTKRLFEFKFPRIAYRYRYQDNEYSAISPFSQIAFAPGSFDYHPKKGYNLGMANRITSIEIEGLKTLLPDGVSEIDVIYKEETSPNLYVVDTIRPNNNPLTSSTYSDIGWTNGKYIINSEQIYKAISSNQILRPYDNVPKVALAQDVVGSRIVYGNYKQGFDLKYGNTDYLPDFSANIISHQINNITLPSVKSLREYQIGAVFVDEYGRETPVISSPVGGLRTDKKDGDTQNKIKISFNNTDYPEGLKYVKFYIKETSGEYYNMAMDRWYDAEDSQVWLSFPSSDINKIKIDDFLILKKGVERNELVTDEAKFKILDIKTEAPEFIKKRKILIEEITHNTDSTAGTVTEIFSDVDALPVKGRQSFKMNYEELSGSLSKDLENESDKNELYIEFVDKANVKSSKRYRINKISSDFNASGIQLADAQYNVILSEILGNEINFICNDSTGNNPTSINDNITVKLYKYNPENSSQFDGKFFVKINSTGAINANILLGSVLTGEPSYRLKYSKRLYSMNSDQITTHRSQLTGQSFGQYGENFGRFAPYFRNYPRQSTYETMGTSDGTKDTGAYRFGQGPVVSNTSMYFNQTITRDDSKLELAYITVGQDESWSWSSYHDFNNNTHQARARRADTHGWKKTERINNTVWFIDGGPKEGIRYNANTYSSLAFGTSYIDASENSNGLGTRENYGGACMFDIGIGGLLRNTIYGDIPGVEPSTAPQTVDHIRDSKRVQADFWNFGTSGGNNNYDTQANIDVVSAIYNSNTKFRFREDPSQEVYTITNSNKVAKLRYDAGKTDGSDTPGGNAGQPSGWLWDDTVLTVTNLNTMLSGTAPPQAGPNYNEQDEGWPGFSGTGYAPHTRKRTAQLSPNFSTNFQIKALNSSGGATIPWDPQGSLGAIAGGLVLTKAHSAYTSGSAHEPEHNYGAAAGDSNAYIFVDDLSATNHDGKTFDIQEKMILTAHSNTDLLDGTDSKEELLIWKIEEVSGAYKLWLCGYRVPLNVSGSTAVGISSHDFVGNKPVSQQNLTFKQPVMNGYTQYSCNRINAQDALDHGYDLYDPDMGIYGGTPGILPVYYHLEIVEEIDRQATLPTDPAIFETEPKETTGLDIYYEASGYNPLYLDNETIQIALPINSIVSNTQNVNAMDATSYIDAHGFDDSITADAGNSGWYIKVIDNGNNRPLIADSNTSYLDVSDNLQINRPDGSSIIVTVTGYTEDTGNRSEYIFISEQLYGSNTSYVLNWHNCFAFGNGVESNRIRDAFNLPFIANGVKASTTLEFSNYKEEHRKYGMIYSGLYNANSGVNNLNQFIAAEKITKDINPIYGSIQKLHTRDSDLIALCEDKVIQILANKDAVFEADGNPQLVASNRVLGQSRPFVGEYGISKNPESFASESYRVYFADKVRGTILRLSMDGLTPISDAGMKDWFRDNLKISKNIIGSYDDKKNEFNITLDQYHSNETGATLTFKEDVKGWSTFKSFVQELGVSCNNNYYTFKEGKMYLHNDESVDRNTFYGEYENSSFNVVLNDMPSVVKSFNTLVYEGTQSKVDQNLQDKDYYNLQNKTGWHVTNITTDKQVGSLNEFIEKEGKWFNYIKGVKSSISSTTDFGAFDIQGIGILKQTISSFAQASEYKNSTGTSNSTTTIQFYGWDYINNIMEFDQEINPSAQVGDTVYYVQSDDLSSNGSFDTVDVNNIVEFGVIIDRTLKSITIAEIDSPYIVDNDITKSINGPVVDPSHGAYILFSKNQNINTSSLLGYFAEAKFENNSIDKVELISVSSEVTESSK